jgi:DNA primase
MNSEKIQILQEILGDFYCSNEEYLFSCPYCNHHKKKMSVNISKNSYKCWVCDTSGRNIFYLVKRFGNYNHRKAWSDFFDERMDISEFDNLFETAKIEEHQQKVSLPNKYICLANKTLSPTAREALKYLKKRGLSSYDILRWKIGYCETGEYKNRIIIPSFNLDGYCNYFIARTYRQDWLKYKNPPVSKDVIFNELSVDWDKPITLVEGVFDAINADNSIPLLGSTLNSHSRLFKAILTHSKRIYIALDQDAERKALNIVNVLNTYGVKVYKIDTSAYEDVGSMTKEEFKERKHTATLFDESTLLIQKILQI